MFRKQKYHLSEDGFDRLTKKLAEIAQENIEDSVEGLRSGVISTSFVKMMTKVSGMDDVISRNEELSKTYQGLLNLYGFDEMYDMYIFARSCDVLPEEIMKSTDRIVMPIQKTVTRNGKPLEVTVYEVLNKAAAPKAKPAKKEEEEVIIRHARELRATLYGDKETKDPKSVAKIKASAKSLKGGNKPFHDGSSHYLSMKDDKGKTAAVIGFSTKGGYMTMDFYRTNGLTNGVAARGFAELVRLAVHKKKGVRIEDHPGARAVYMQFGLEQKGDHWEASYDELKESLGEGPYGASE
jgi:hypothetical protein